MKRISKVMATTIMLLLVFLMAFATVGCDVGEYCTHKASGEGTVVERDGKYYYLHKCELCNEDFFVRTNEVYTVKEVFYNETSHWDYVEYVDILTGAVRTSKANETTHSLNAAGYCEHCDYNNNEAQGLVYAENATGTGYVVTGKGTCLDKHINIPKTHLGKPVVGIGDNAFDDVVETEGESTSKESKIVGITIPDTVVEISCKAFAECDELLNFLVDAANQVYTSTDNCLINKVLKTLVRGCEYSIIPSDGQITMIGSYAFANLSGLVSISIPDTVTKIGDKAFFECDALVEIKLPDLINMGVDVFRGSVHVVIKIRHDLVFVPAVEATCQKAGNIAHFKCKDCGDYYEDEDGLVKIYSVTIAPSHDFVDGVCSKCGAILDEVKIVSIDKVEHLGQFPLGTLENAIGLPASINVYTADGKKHELAVIWDLTNYDKSKVGEYTITGVIQSDNFHFAEGLNGNVEAKLEIVEKVKGTADIVFVLDISGSMGDEIANVKNNIIAFSKAIEEKGVSARWSVITYSDFQDCPGDPNEVTTIIKNGATDWFTNAESYKSAISSISLAYGGDEPEAAVDGLMMATTLSTRKDARVFYILLTDANYKTANNFGVSNMGEVEDILDEDSVNVSVITGSSLYSSYNSIVSTTGGILSNITGNFSQDLIDALVPIIYEEVIA